MLKSSLTRKIVSLFMIWLAILLPVELSEALSFTSAPSVSDLKPDGATVKWISDQQATGTAYYGEGSPTNTVSEQEASIVHEIQLTGLTPSTTYYFYASMTAGGVETTNDNQGNYFTFTTAEPADVNPPHAPVDLKTTLVGHSSIALSWTSSTEDGDVDSYNVYLNGEKQTNTKSRTYQNSNLEPETSYKFEISAVDTSGNEGPKAQLDVSTISEHVRPITVGQIKTEVLGTDAIFSWDTDYPTNALLKYGTTPMTLDQSTSLQNYNQSHQINLTGLQPNTTYTYEVNACDIYNNCRNKTGTIQTAEDVPLFLELSSPAINSSEPDEVYYHNSFEIDIIGRAAAYSDVSVSVNGKKARFKRIREDQTFQFNGISLDRDANSTLLEIVAKGRKGGEMRIARQVSVDRHTPDVTDFFMPSFTAESSFYVSGNLTDQTDVVAKMYILKDALAFHVEKDENDDFPDWYLQQGEQTRMTKEVKDAAAAIEDKATDRETVQAILDWTRNLNACDTAPQSRSRPSKAIITSGCAADSVDYALAFVAVARQKGIPAKYVETVEAEWAACVSEYGMDDPQCKEKKEHVFSEVWLEDEWAAVDPSAGAFTEKDDKGHFRSSEYQDSTMLTLAYGRDSWGIGIDNEGGFKDKMEQAVAQGTSAEKVKVFIKEEEIFRNGPFNLSFGPLEEGKDNDVVIDFVDQAGNVLNFEKLITYDTTPPKIISP
ncbi:MAG: fibronectin type III domain-containing protein, partial [Candidatus Nanoarchaeia archaeon]